MNWLTDFDSSFNNCGDLPKIEALPHMGERAATFAGSMTGPQGERPKVEPGFFAWVIARFTRDNSDEIETLRLMLKETGE